MVMHTLLVTFAIDVARVTIWLVLLLIVFVPLERIFAEKPYRIWRREFGLDLVWYFGNGVLTTTLLAFVTAMAAVGLSRFVPHAAASMPLWQRMLATLAVGEFGFYWGHRWSHEIPLLWRFHAIHHTAEQVDWLTNTRGHPVDIVFTRLCGFVPIYLLGLAQMDMTPHSVAVSLLMIFTNTWGFFIHANLKWRLGWLEAVIATPAFHRWHHTADINRDHNFASTLPIYDRLFGTLYLPTTGAPPRFGVDGAVPRGFISQALAPFAPPPRHDPA